jgi:hypothetical protein
MQEQSLSAARTLVLPPTVRNQVLQERGDEMLHARHRPLIDLPTMMRILS